MKKSFAALAVLVLFGCLCAGAPAEAPAALAWADYEGQILESEIPAAFYSLGDTGLMMWVPVYFAEQEILPTEAEMGLIASFAMNGGEASVFVAETELDEDTTAESLQKDLPERGAAYADLVSVNGLDAVSFPFEEDDAMCLMLNYAPGKFMMVEFCPVSNETMAAMMPLMTASIQAENMQALLQQDLVNDRATEPEIRWEDAADEAAGLDPEGGFAPIAGWNLRMWRPGDMVEAELTQEDRDKGIVAILGTEDGSRVVTVTENEGADASLENWRDAFISVGNTDAEIVAVNGIRALRYSDAETDTLNVMYCVSGSEDTLIISFWPASDGDYAALAALMLASISPAE